MLEDDESFAQVVTIRLRSWMSDVEITHVRTIAEGGSVLEASSELFALAILDQHLPDGLGTELISHPKLADSAILAVSADAQPDLPANTVKAGAQHFLGKRQVTEALFLPLLEALLERKELERKLFHSRVHEAKLHSIKVLLATLRHEINNPLGAVLGGAYLLKSVGNLDLKQADALRLIEASGQRIKHVIQQLCEAAELQEVTKAHEQVFQVPGDSPWPSRKRPTGAA